MRTHLKKVLAGVCALAALALGGAAISQAGNSTPHQRSSEPATEQERNAPENSATDRDNVQDENGKEESGKDENGESRNHNETSGQAKKEESDKLLAGDAANRARQAAAAKTGGTAGDVENGGDRGVAYEVEVTKADGKKIDVYVDGQYKVVAVHADNERSDRAAEQGRRDK